MKIKEKCSQCWVVLGRDARPAPPCGPSGPWPHQLFQLSKDYGGRELRVVRAVIALAAAKCSIQPVHCNSVPYEFPG